VRGGKSLTLASSDLKAENSLDEPTRLSPVEKTLSAQGPEFTHAFEPNSLTVLRVTTVR
jgi:alpha-L-arabinofuranosidase